MVRHPGRYAQACRGFTFLVPEAGLDGPTHRPVRASVPRRVVGTGGRTRTGTLLRAGDFESPVSTNFTTLA